MAKLSHNELNISFKVASPVLGQSISSDVTQKIMGECIKLIKYNDITTTKQNTTKPLAYILWNILYRVYDMKSQKANTLNGPL